MFALPSAIGRQVFAEFLFHDYLYREKLEKPFCPVPHGIDGWAIAYRRTEATEVTESPHAEF